MVKRKTNPTSTTTEIDPELLEDKYNELRKPSLPYGIVINDKPAGILIPTEQLTKAKWLEEIDENSLTTVELTEEVTGLFLTKCRMIVLAFVPEYVRWKDIEENFEKAGTPIALYEDYRNRLDKKTQDVVSEHALDFLNNKNQPLHEIPIVVRFKNVALWSFKSAREKFYNALEKVFAEYYDIPYSGKSDKWRSLGVLNIQFQAIKEGEGKNKSFCCKTYRITTPTLSNLTKLFLGQPKRKEQIWNFHENIAGFTESNNNQLPALTSSAEPEIQVLTGETESNRKPRQISQVTEDDSEDDDFLDNVETDEFDLEL